MKKDTEIIFEAFERRFGGSADTVAVNAPGRVNLIGEHTDYNDGFVLPVALDFGVVIVGAARRDRKVRVQSLDYGETVELDLDAQFDNKTPRWSRYVEGVARVFESELCEKLPGFDAVVSGDVPQGTGLSSSAALEVATGCFINEIHGLCVGRRDIALYGQKAEHEYLGMMCGIMDQFASALCAPDSALFLDCRSRGYEQVPLALSGHVIMILNTNRSRGLVDSEYNARRRACEEGVRLISQWEPCIKALRDVTPDMLGRYSDRLPEAVLRKCRHVVEENRRVREAVESLENGDLATFGTLMSESHDSLRDDYEVSCRELDVMNEIARSHDGVPGARMTGAGFGGCVVALVREDAAGALRERIMAEYPQKTGREPEVYVTLAAGGVARLER